MSGHQSLVREFTTIIREVTIKLVLLTEYSVIGDTIEVAAPDLASYPYKPQTVWATRQCVWHVLIGFQSIFLSKNNEFDAPTIAISFWVLL